MVVMIVVCLGCVFSLSLVVDKKLPEHNFEVCILPYYKVKGFPFWPTHVCIIPIADVESLLMVMNEIVPIGNLEWERVCNRHASCYPGQERTAELLMCKFQQPAHKKKPAGDPSCLPYICSAKHI
jgi:hypothetical protein